MHKPITYDELIAHDGISPEDKDLIEGVVAEHLDRSEGPERTNALRGFLVELFEELGPNDDLRRGLDQTAANFSDGWSYCLNYSQR